MLHIIIDREGNLLKIEGIELYKDQISIALEVIELYKNGEITLEELLEDCPEVKITDKFHEKNPSPKAKKSLQVKIDKEGNILAKEGRELYEGQISSTLEVIELYKNGEITLEELLEDCPEVKITDEFHTKKIPTETTTSTKQQRTGKLYALGDIHGKWEAYHTAIEMTSSQDRVIILGDVIDRGRDGIKILQDIMQRENVEFILGNHEFMMLEALNVVRKYNLNLDDCINVLAPYYQFMSRLKEMKPEYIDKATKKLEEVGVKQGLFDIQGRIKQQGESYNQEDLEKIGTWLLSANCGTPTCISFLQLPEEEQNQIYDYLCNSYVMLCEETKDQDILFVHAQPSQDLNLIKKLHTNHSGVKYNEISREDVFPMVWNRREKDGEDSYVKCKKEGLLTICGHEPEHANIKQNWDNGYICIDAGSGHGGRVALYDVENDDLELIMEDGTIDKNLTDTRDSDLMEEL
mgnify:CR=1 FL=1